MIPAYSVSNSNRGFLPATSWFFLLASLMYWFLIKVACIAILSESVSIWDPNHCKSVILCDGTWLTKGASSFKIYHTTLQPQPQHHTMAATPHHGCRNHNHAMDAATTTIPWMQLPHHTVDTTTTPCHGCNHLTTPHCSHNHHTMAATPHHSCSHNTMTIATATTPWLPLQQPQPHCSHNHQTMAPQQAQPRLQLQPLCHGHNHHTMPWKEPCYNKNNNKNNNNTTTRIRS